MIQPVCFQFNIPYLTYPVCFLLFKILHVSFRYLGAAAAKLLQSCPTLCDPIDGSPLGSPVSGILQARTLVGCHFLVQCMKVKSESEVTQSCPTPCDPMDCSLPGSSILRIFQARVLEWGHTQNLFLLWCSLNIIGRQSVLGFLCFDKSCQVCQNPQTVLSLTTKLDYFCSRQFCTVICYLTGTYYIVLPSTRSLSRERSGMFTNCYKIGRFFYHYVYYRILNIVPYTIQRNLVIYPTLFYIYINIYIYKIYI